MYRNKTLVVLFCMHRSGSSFAGRLFQRLGMSLGPFELLGAQESNPHGHFEAAPFVALNREIQLQAFGYSEDRPQEPAIWRRLRECGGEWPAETAIGDRELQEGRRLIEQLVASGPVSGFKDPRTALTWPFWGKVLREFAGLRVVPLFLIRSPHEIAMSLFRRARGDCSYDDALDLAAVHYRRMRAIYDAWQGARAVLQFEPEIYARQAPVAAAMCGLKWDTAAFAETFDPDCRHHVPAVVAHEAQTLFEQLGGTRAGTPLQGNLGQLMADAAEREQILRHRCASLAAAAGENGTAQAQIASGTAEIRRLAAEKASEEARRQQLEVQLRALEAERASWEAHRRQIEVRLQALEAEKVLWDGYRRSRGWAVLQAAWELRQLLVPRRSWREAAAKITFRCARRVVRQAKGIVFH